MTAGNNSPRRFAAASLLCFASLWLMGCSRGRKTEELLLSRGAGVGSLPNTYELRRIETCTVEELGLRGDLRADGTPSRLLRLCSAAHPRGAPHAETQQYVVSS